MNYVEIRNLFDERKIDDIDADIVCCVRAASFNLSDEEFTLVCAYTRTCWDEVDRSYTQLIADIVCDLYQDNLEYGYRSEDRDLILTREDIENKEKIDMVLDLFYERY